MALDQETASKITAAFKGSGGRSDLYETLWELYPMLDAARAASQRRPDWVGLTAELNRSGIKTSAGRKLKSETVRRTFLRVKRWYDANPSDLTTPAALPASTTVAPPAPRPPTDRASFRDKIKAATYYPTNPKKDDA